jgi:hypothetical protein
MKNIIFLLLINLPLCGFTQNPLSLYDPIWDNHIYDKCNTAENAPYLSQREKELIWVLNCYRQYPQTFIQTVAAKWENPKRYKPIDKNNLFYTSLFKTANQIKPSGLLYPDSMVYYSAKTQCISSGNYFGHERHTYEAKKAKCNCGEVISYNSFDPIDIIMDLLIDNGNLDFSHRKILSLDTFKFIGCSTFRHNIAFYITVINLK